MTSQMSLGAGMGAGGGSVLSGWGVGQGDPRTSPNRERCRVLLVIDGPHVDWMRLFHGRRLHGDWGIRVEQAQFSEISLSAYSEAGVSIDICRGENRVVRSLRPDFVLLRQHTRDATDNWKNVILGLQYGGIPSINSLHSIYNFMDKPWVFAQLIQIQKRLGKEKFPLIEQCYYPNYKEMLVSSKFPIVVKIGHAHSGSGKVKVENQQSFQDIASLTAVANSYSTTELLVEAQCDIYIEKIGNSYKAFTRKSVSGNWKASSGSVVLEQIAMTERYRMWADECSLLFGGLDMLAVQAVQAKDGQEYIIDVTDSSMALLGGGAQGDDYRQVVDLVVNKMEVYCRKASIPQSSISKTTSAGALTDYTVANGPSPQQHAFEQMRNHPYTSAATNQPAGGPTAAAAAAPHPLAAASSPFPPPSGPPQQPPRPPPTASAPPRPVSQRPIPTGMGLQEQQQPPQPPQRPGSSTQVDIRNKQPPPPPPPPTATSPPPPVPPPSSAGAGGVGLPRQSPFAAVPPPPPPQQQQGAAAAAAAVPPPQPRELEEADDTMKNLRKTFAGIFGNM